MKPGNSSRALRWVWSTYVCASWSQNNIKCMNTDTAEVHCLSRGHREPLIFFRGSVCRVTPNKLDSHKSNIKLKWKCVPVNSTCRHFLIVLASMLLAYFVLVFFFTLLDHCCCLPIGHWARGRGQHRVVTLDDILLKIHIYEQRQKHQNT